MQWRYAVDVPRRRYADVEQQRLQVRTWDGKVYRWIGELDVNIAKDAAEQLFYELKEVVRGTMGGSLDRQSD